ncbi:sensor histidine kinase [Bowdeniella nasicola]|uniref:sensor histidine kinase n=1 Tax=Bowdeniella nasicola TaxID=208480 RepID=UPI001FE7BEBF|nr:ATP-binding protein [Bowdeniella nasicola]
MDIPWQAILAALLGLLVGSVSVAAFRVSQHRMRGGEIPESEDISSDESNILSVLSGGTVLLRKTGEILRADATAASFGLVVDGKLVDGPVKDVFDKVVETGNAVQADVEVPRSNLSGASVYYLTVRLSPLPRERVLLAATDRTEKVRLENTRRDFMQNVSHELKTPVGALALLAETVHDSAEDPEAVRKFSSRMTREAKRLGRLVTEIIELSRLESPDALGVGEVVNVDEVVEEAVDRVRVTAEGARVELVAGGETGTQVYGDTSLLMTAVRNLLDNAIRYSNPLSRVNLGVSADSEVVRIAVVDEGIGVSPDQKERIFERFYRVDDARSRETGGTGLGLSIVKHIAADHGGTVTLWSEPGRGSTFTLVLPRAFPAGRYPTSNEKEPS